MKVARFEAPSVLSCPANTKIGQSSPRQVSFITTTKFVADFVLQLFLYALFTLVFYSYCNLANAALVRLLG